LVTLLQMTRMKVRILASLIGLPLLTIIILIGNPYFTIACIPIGILATYEAMNLTPFTDSKIPRKLIYIVTLLFIIYSFIALSISIYLIGSLIIISVCFIISILWVITNNDLEYKIQRIIYINCIPLYCGFLFSHILILYIDTSLPIGLGLSIIIFTMCVTFAGDTGAYFVGTYFGKIKIVPAISANKTLEGSIGGLCSSVIVSVIVSTVIDIQLNILPLLFIGVSLGVMGQLGDLFESKLKRIKQIKDSGTFLPGHGGLLDRIDSLIITIPTSYYLFYIFLV
jgi:phosphatidate cytidylyltransferase